MNPFLDDLADEILLKHSGNLSRVVIVFPNRRAILYFKKYLAARITTPVFTPQLYTIEDFFCSFSDLRVPDKLELVLELYEAWKVVLPEARETMAEFYFWGEMLLRDFDELDKYLIEIAPFFKDLRYDKELQNVSDLFTEEQLQYLREFWSIAELDRVGHQKFMELWVKLPELYNQFNERLSKKNLAYTGMIQRQVITNLTSLANATEPYYYFAGFNALTKTEELLLEYFVREGKTSVVWDLDQYYTNNQVQEAGLFFREYRTKPLLGTTFPDLVPSNQLNKKFPLRIIGTTSGIAQTKLLAQHLAEDTLLGRNDNNTLIVVGHEQLLLPVLAAISNQVTKINVTMGFPLMATPIPGLIDSLAVYWRDYHRGSIRYENLELLIVHPFIQAGDPLFCNEFRRELAARNKLWLRPSELTRKHGFYDLLLHPEADSNPVTWLRSVFQHLATFNQLTDTDVEFIYSGLKLITRLLSALPLSAEKFETEFLPLLKVLVRSEKIPFSGEPLEGVQVMGVLETRNLDFDFVYIVSLNEGHFPASARKGTYLPFTLRLAWGLPTFAHHDAIYAYLFYRSWQRATKATFYYTTGTDKLGDQEISRYLLQLRHEYGPNLTVELPTIPQSLTASRPIVIPKDENVLAELRKLTEDRYLSPTLIYDYLKCSYFFYLRYILRIKEVVEVQEVLAPLNVGNVIHESLEDYYNQILKNHSGLVTTDLLDNPDIEPSILVGFTRVFNNSFIESDFTGEYYLLREIALIFIKQLLSVDRMFAPFQVLETESEAHTTQLDLEGISIKLGGKIDRIDSKENIIRIIDYKTGKEDTKDTKIPDLFTYNSNRKGVFQLHYYAWIHFMKNQDPLQVYHLVIYNNDIFTKNKEFNPLKIYPDRIDEFGIYLRQTISEIFNPEIPFVQTEVKDNCKYCFFNKLCHKS